MDNYIQAALRRKLRGAAMVAAAILIFCAEGFAEVLTPKSVEYDVEAKHEAQAASCVVRTTISNYPTSPEIANFRAGLWTGEQPNAGLTAFTGFTLDVGDMKFQGGIASGVEKRALTKAAFSSPTFNSVGRLYDTDMVDGGLGAVTADTPTAVAFLAAIEQGVFDISFIARSPPEERTYQITNGPSPTVMRAFRKCVSAMQQ